MRDEAAAERGHGAFRGEDALRGLVPERGRARTLVSSPSILTSSKTRKARDPSTSSARGARTEIARSPAPSRDSNTTSLSRKIFSPFSSNLTASVARTRYRPSEARVSSY